MQSNKNGWKVVAVFLLFVLLGVGGLLFSFRQGYLREDFINGSNSDTSDVNESTAVPLMNDKDYVVESERGMDNMNLAHTSTRDRKIIRMGRISMYVDDIKESEKYVKEITQKYDGLITNSYMSATVGVPSSLTMTIKVPVKHLDQIIEDVKNVADEIISVNFDSDDVTEAYIDNKARLNVLKSTRQQYLKLMDKAKNVNEVIAIQKELMWVQQQIEVLETQQKNYRRRSAMSTIVISMQTKPDNMPANAKWRPIAVAKNALSALTHFIRWIVNVFIWAIVFSPVWGGVLALIIFVRKRKKRK